MLNFLNYFRESYNLSNKPNFLHEFLLHLLNSFLNTSVSDVNHWIPSYLINVEHKV